MKKWGYKSELVLVRRLKGCTGRSVCALGGREQRETCVHVITVFAGSRDLQITGTPAVPDKCRVV